MLLQYRQIWHHVSTAYWCWFCTLRFGRLFFDISISYWKLYNRLFFFFVDFKYNMLLFILFNPLFCQCSTDNIWTFGFSSVIESLLHKRKTAQCQTRHLPATSYRTASIQVNRPSTCHRANAAVSLANHWLTLGFTCEQLIWSCLFPTSSNHMAESHRRVAHRN